MKNDETKNRIISTDEGIYFVSYREDGLTDDVVKILPAIEDVEEIENGGTNVVAMYFSDGTETKAILYPGDNYSFEEGVSICITKRIIDCLMYGHGSSIYNKLVRHAMKVYKDNRYAEAKYEAEVIREKERIAKKKQKAAERRARRKAEAVERETKVLQKAIVGALEEFSKMTENK